MPHIFAAGDVTGALMLVPQAMQAGFVAGTNAVLGETTMAERRGDSDRQLHRPGVRTGRAHGDARPRAHDVIVVTVPFRPDARTIIDGRTDGFCKLIVERAAGRILGCHVVGERAVDIVQTAAVAMAAELRVDRLARVPLSFPTYGGILGRAAAMAARQLQQESGRIASSGPGR